MSTQPEKLFDRSLKEWALIILVVNLGIVMAVFVYAVAIALANSPDGVTIKGEIDLGQFTGIIIGVAMVAVTLVAQQMTARQTITTMRTTDDAWAKNP
jgi:carbon starvation protein CstA